MKKEIKLLKFISKNKIVKERKKRKREYLIFLGGRGLHKNVTYRVTQKLNPN